MAADRQYDIERRRDAAFFEDWSAWSDLAGEGARGESGRYFCSLNRHGFEVCVPSSQRCYVLLKSVPQARIKRTGRYTPIGETWTIPVEEWRSLRDVLPRLAREIQSQGKRQ